MNTEIMNNASSVQLTKQNKVVSLFQFIEELNKLKQKSIINVNYYKNNNGWFYSLTNLPNDPDNITVFYRDRVEDEDASIGNTLLSVHKPEFTRCPSPDVLFASWLEYGWDNYRYKVSVKSVLSDKNEAQASLLETDGEEETVEHFEDNADRVAAYQKWLVSRLEWVEKQKITERTRNLFADLYRLYFELRRDSETMEMIVATGILYDRDKPELEHPNGVVRTQ